MERATTKEGYDDLSDEILEVREEKQKILSQRAADNGRRLVKEQVLLFLRKQTSRITEYDEELVRKLIERILIHADGSITVIFKSGTEIHSQII